MKPDRASEQARDMLMNGDQAMNQAAQDLNAPDSLQARQRAARRLLAGGPIDINSKAYKAAQRRMMGLPSE